MGGRLLIKLKGIPVKKVSFNVISSMSGNKMLRVVAFHFYENDEGEKVYDVEGYVDQEEFYSGRFNEYLKERAEIEI